MKETWRCPKCKMEAKIDREKKTKEFVHKLSPDKGRMSFPTHSDCELAKTIGKMDFTKLEKK